MSLCLSVHAEEAAAPATPPVDEVPTTEVAPPVKAADPSALGTLDQIFRDKKKALGSVADDSIPPLVVSVETAPGEACEGRVESSEGRKLVLDFIGCHDFDKVKAGAALRKSPFAMVAKPPSPEPAAKPVETPVSSSSHVGFDLAIGTSTATELRFDSASVTTAGGSSVDGSDIYTVGTAGQISAGVMWAPEHAFGIYGGFTFQQKRDIKYERAEFNGYTAYALPNATVTFVFTEISAIYRWSYVYLPFGFNFSRVDLSLPSGNGLNFTTSGGLGAQLGIGVFLSPNVHLEVLSQALSMKISGTANVGGSFDSGMGYLSGLTLKVGYLF